MMSTILNSKHCHTESCLDGQLRPKFYTPVIGVNAESRAFVPDENTKMYEILMVQLRIRLFRRTRFARECCVHISKKYPCAALISSNLNCIDNEQRLIGNKIYLEYKELEQYCSSKYLGFTGRKTKCDN